MNEYKLCEFCTISPTIVARQEINSDSDVVPEPNQFRVYGSLVTILLLTPVGERNLTKTH